jgi:hypothetical protein
VNAGFQCVREAPGGGPIFMINISQAGIELVRYEHGIHAVWTATRDEPHVTADPLLPIGLIRNFRDAKHPDRNRGTVIRQHLKAYGDEAV